MVGATGAAGWWQMKPKPSPDRNSTRARAIFDLLQSILCAGGSRGFGRGEFADGEILRFRMSGSTDRLTLLPGTSRSFQSTPMPASFPRREVARECASPCDRDTRDSQPRADTPVFFSMMSAVGEVLGFAVAPFFPDSFMETLGKGFRPAVRGQRPRP